MRYERKQPAIHAVRWTGSNLEEVREFLASEGTNMRAVAVLEVTSASGFRHRIPMGEWLARREGSPHVSAYSDASFRDTYQVP